MEQLLDKICHHDDQDTNELLRGIRPCQSAPGDQSANCERTQILLKRLKARDEDLRLAAEIGQAIVHKYDDLLLEKAKLATELSERVIQLGEAEERLATAEETARQLTVDNQHWKQRSAETLEALQSLEIRQQDQMREERRQSSIELSATAASPLTPEEQRAMMNEMTLKENSVHELMQELEKFRRENRQLQMELHRAGRRDAEDLALLRQKAEQFDTISAERDRISKSLLGLQQEKTDLEGRLDEVDQLTAAVKELTQLNERLAADNQEQKRLLADARQELTDLKESTMIFNEESRDDLYNDQQSSFAMVGSPGTDEQLSPRTTVASGRQRRLSSGVFDARISSSIFGELESYLQASLRKSSLTEQNELNDSTPTKQPLLSNTPDSNNLLNSNAAAVGASRRTSNVSNLFPTIHQPLRLLCTLASQYHQRLTGSSTVSLNRRLRRAFDAKELTVLSNSIIDNVLHDVATMSERFGSSTADSVVFDPLVRLISGLLKDLGRQRKTLNDYGLAYVSKMEEWSRKDVEERERRQRIMQEQKRSQQSNHSREESSGSWSQMLRRSISAYYYSPSSSRRRVVSERPATAGTPPSPSHRVIPASGSMTPDARLRRTTQPIQHSLRPSQSVYVARDRRRMLAASATAVSTANSPTQSSPLRRNMQPQSSSRSFGGVNDSAGSDSVGWRHASNLHNSLTPNSSATSANAASLLPTDTASVTPAPSAVTEDSSSEKVPYQSHSSLKSTQSQRQECSIQ